MPRYIKNFLILSLTSTVLLGCSDSNSKAGTNISVDQINKHYKIVCINSVEYILYASVNRGFLAPHFNQDSTVNTCNKIGEQK